MRVLDSDAEKRLFEFLSLEAIIEKCSLLNKSWREKAMAIQTVRITEIWHSRKEGLPFPTAWEAGCSDADFDECCKRLRIKLPSAIRSAVRITTGAGFPSRGMSIAAPEVCLVSPLDWHWGERHSSTRNGWTEKCEFGHELPLRQYIVIGENPASAFPVLMKKDGGIYRMPPVQEIASSFYDWLENSPKLAAFYEDAAETPASMELLVRGLVEKAYMLKVFMDEIVRVNHRQETRYQKWEALLGAEAGNTEPPGQEAIGV